MQFVYNGATVTPSPFPSPTSYPISGPAPGVSVPEFTLALVSHPYDVPATSPIYTTNPYTGAQEQVSSGSAGYNVQNSTIQLSIRNQHVAYSDGSMAFITFYNIRVKGHFSQNWTEISFLDENPSIKTVSTPDAVLVVESSSDYTVVQIPANTFPDDSKVDFQVQAILGCYNTRWVWDTRTIFNMYEQWYVGNTDCGSYLSSFVAESTSDWSNTQTLNLTDGSVYGSTQVTSALSPSPTSAMLENPSQNLPSTPNQAYASLSTSQFNLGWVEVVASATLVMVVALLVALIAYMHRKIRVLETKPNDKGND